MVLLLASEVPDLLGRRGERLRRRAVLRLWERVDGDSLRSARARTCLTNEEDDIEEDKSRATDIERPLRRGDLREILRVQMLKPASMLGDATSARRAIDEICSIGEREKRESAIRRLFDHASLELSPTVLARANAEIERISHTTEPAQLYEECRRAVAMPRQKDCARLASRLRARVAALQGSRLRDVALTAYEDLTGAPIIRTDEFFTRDVGDGTSIGDHVRALAADGGVLEVTCDDDSRGRRETVDIDYVPMLVRMHVSYSPSFHVVHMCEGDVRVDTYEYDEDAWEVVQDEVISFAAGFGSLLADVEAQDEFLCERVE